MATLRMEHGTKVDRNLVHSRNGHIPWRDLHLQTRAMLYLYVKLLRAGQLQNLAVLLCVREVPGSDLGP
jgi:hypothetical protein